MFSEHRHGRGELRSVRTLGDTARDTQQIVGLAVDSVHLYWSELSRSRGHIYKCTLPSCTDAPIDMIAYSLENGLGCVNAGVDLPDGTSEGRLTSVALP